MNPATILAQLDHFTDPATGAFVPPVPLGVTGKPLGQPGADSASRYARSGNDAALLAERVLAKLDGAEAAAAFTSAVAIAHAILATLQPGDHVLLDTGTYYEFANIFTEFAHRWQIETGRADLTDPAATSAALRPGRTRLVWAECPSNPLWRVPDIAVLAEAAHAAGARLLVDATVATPILCQPLRLGADLVLHSATKYLGGHGDLLAGILATAAAGQDWDAVLAARTRHGTVLPPFEAWLLLRGLRTLALRIDRVSMTALRVAHALADHPAVAATHYPGLPADPWHETASRQFSGGFGGMVSFQIPHQPDIEATARAICARFRLFRRATSLGSTESLVEHRLTTEGAGSECPPGLIRLSIGLEHPDDLLADLEQALSGPS